MGVLWRVPEPIEYNPSYIWTVQLAKQKFTVASVKGFENINKTGHELCFLYTDTKTRRNVNTRLL